MDGGWRGEGEGSGARAPPGWVGKDPGGRGRTPGKDPPRCREGPADDGAGEGGSRGGRAPSLSTPSLATRGRSSNFSRDPGARGPRRRPASSARRRGWRRSRLWPQFGPRAGRPPPGGADFEPLLSVFWAGCEAESAGRVLPAPAAPMHLPGCAPLRPTAASRSPATCSAAPAGAPRGCTASKPSWDLPRTTGSSTPSRRSGQPGAPRSGIGGRARGPSAPRRLPEAPNRLRCLPRRQPRSTKVSAHPGCSETL